MRRFLVPMSVVAGALLVFGSVVLDRPGGTGHTAAGLTPGSVAGQSSQGCSYRWDSEHLPTLTAHVEAALAGAGLTGATASAQAQGERCVDTQAGTSHFMAMSSFVGLAVPVDSASDLEALGNVTAVLADAIVPVLSTASRDVMPGPNPPNVQIGFKAPGATTSLRTSLSTLQTTRSQGLSGAALLAALGYTP